MRGSAVVEDMPVSLSAFNAALPDIVQLGGIYTPPAALECQNFYTNLPILMSMG
jgi:hypothetical protein